MAVSIVTYTGDGSTTQYVITFEYISRDDVVVQVNDVDASFTFVNDTTIELASAPEAGDSVNIKRETPSTALVDFADGSTLFESDLDLSARQSRYLAEEARDRADEAIAVIDANLDDVIAVAGIESEVTAVAAIDTDVSIVADINTAVQTVSSINAAVSQVSSISSDVTAVSGINADVTAVADNLSNVSSVGTISEDVTTVASISTDVTAAASNATDISTVASSITDVNTVADNYINVNTVAGISSDVTSVASISSDITAVANTNLTSVINNAANIATVSNNIAAVNTVSANVSSVTNVSNNISSINSFSNQYTVSATAPTNANDGLLWFDTSTDTMKVYNGSSFQNAGSSVNGTADRVVYTSSAGQTTFAAIYDSGYVDVYLNGVKLIDGTDFTATDGSSIILATGAAAGDTVDIVAYGTFQLTTSYTKGQVDALIDDVETLALAGL